MSFVTVPAKYSNGIIEPIGKISYKKPVRVMVTFEYTEEESNYKNAMKDFDNGENIYEMDNLNELMRKRGVIK